ncbi:MAG: hypothetical protein J5989_05830 [Alistipes sp.]|nr:hypothetical protein [Alistipes sp.]
MRRFFILSLIMLVASCGKSIDYAQFAKGEPEPIKFEKIKLDSQMLYSDNIFVVDNYLVNLNSKNPKGLFELYTLPDVKFVGAAGYKGRGPQEFVFINTNGTNPAYRGLNVTESNTYSQVEFYLSEGSVKLRKNDHTTFPSKHAIANSLLMVSDSTAVMYINNEDDVEFYMHNRKSGSMRPISSYPKELVAQNPTSEACNSVFMNDLVINPSNGKFAAIYSQLPMVRVFDNSGKLETTSLLDNWEQQRFEISGDEVKTSSSCQYYLASAANSNYICALYLGKFPAEMEQMSMEDARLEIHVWNWAGELVATYLPDSLVMKIAIADDNTIYATSPLDDMHIYSYKLK